MKKGGSPQLFFILAALTLAAGTGATIFQYSELGDKWDSLEELKKDMRDPKDIQAELDDTGQKVTSSQAEIEHLEKGVPEFAYVPTMLKELEAFGKQNGIEVLGIRPIPKPTSGDKNGKPKPKEAYQEIAIEVKGRGGFKAVQSFVTALEKFPKIVGARAVSLQPKNEPGATGPAKLDVTIELRAYLFPPEKPQDVAAVSPEPTTGGTQPPKTAAPAGAFQSSEAGNSPGPAAKGGSK